jgi:hypothetical protein
MSLALCIAGAKALTIAATSFTLGWTHSVQKTEWREDWTVGPAGLTLVEARVKGSGAGMEPGENAVLKDGWWVWQPDVKAVPVLVLAASGATGTGWRLCTAGGCHDLGETEGDPVRLSACRAP